VKNKLLTLGWFLRRPPLWGQALRAVRFRLFPHPGEHTREQSVAWCRERAVELPEALEHLFGLSDVRPFAECEPAHVAWGRRVAEEVHGFMGGAGDLDLLYHAVRASEAERVVETGVALGWSSLAILSALAPRGRLVSTDMPYVREGNAAEVGAVVPEELRDRWLLLRGADRRVLPRGLRTLGAVDLVHYDSDKSYVGRRWAYPRLWAALRPGGLLISDDIDDNVAFRDFADEVGVEPLVVGSEGRARYVGVLVRPR